MDCQAGGRGSLGDGLANAPGATGATLQNFEGSKNAADSAPVAAENQHTIEPLALPIAKDPLAIADHPPGGTRLSADAARTLTDQIRRDTTLVYVQLLRAYEGNAHGALGYTSWGAYCEAELQIGRSRSYRLIDAARVAEVVQSPTGDSDTQTITANPAPPALSERVARELSPLLGDPDELRHTYVDSIETAPRDATGRPAVTASHVRATVETRREVRDHEGVAPITVTAPKLAKPRMNVLDAVAHVAKLITVSGPNDELQDAARKARAVLDKRWRGTAPETLAACIRVLLDAIVSGTP